MARSNTWLRGPGLRVVVFAAGIAPAALLLLEGLAGRLGANPIETLQHATGDWSLRFLLAALAVTPARRLLGWSFLAAHRRTLGLFAFFYVCMHLMNYVVLDLFFDLRAILEDVTERPYITAGFTGFLCLLPLAITSTRGWTRRLGRRWVQLHRLAYVAGVAGVVHYLWLVKADLLAPLVHAAILALLLGTRLWQRYGRRLAAAPRPLV